MIAATAGSVPQPREDELFSIRLSLQHTFQFIHALLNLCFQFREVGQNFLGRSVRNFFVNDLFVAVNGEIVVLCSDVFFWNEERLVGTFAGAFVRTVLGTFLFASLPTRW
jgi:hypothetical protein